MNRDQKMLEEAYVSILESKHINKKFARRYNKITTELLKAKPGSKEYQKIKNERDDLVSILKDHGKTPADLEEMFAKKEVAAESEPEDEPVTEEQGQSICKQCGDGHVTENCPETGGLPH